LPLKPKILVVDDDREIVRGLSIRLRAAGYEVRTAYNGEDGLAAAIEMLPDAIVLDIRMPGMDGFAVLDNLLRHNDTKSIPVVMLSANAIERAKAKALDLGACYFMEKPYDAVRLTQSIESAIKKSHGTIETTATHSE